MGLEQRRDGVPYAHTMGPVLYMGGGYMTGWGGWGVAILGIMGKVTVNWVITCGTRYTLLGTRVKYNRIKVRRARQITGEASGRGPRGEFGCFLYLADNLRIPGKDSQG